MSRAKIKIISLALKNLSRHKFKTFFTVSAIVIGVSLFVWMDAWLLGMNLDSKRNLVNYETGSAKIYSKAYFEKKDELPTYEAFTDYQEILDTLSREGYNAAPRAVFVGSLLSLDQEVPFVFLGVEPELEKQMFKYHNFIEGEGATFVENNTFKTLIGARGAKDLKVTVGDKVRCSVTIDVKMENGKIRHIHQLIDLTVGGIVNSPNPKTNGNIAYVPLDILQDEMGLMLEGKINEICIRQKGATEDMLPGRNEDPVVISAKLGDVLPGDLVLVGWQEDAKDYIAMSKGDIYGSYIMIGILLLLAIIGVVNTMLMAIFERTKEIGMIKALGMKDGEVMRLFIFESALIGLIGAVIGILIALPFIHLTVKYGIDYTNMMEQMNIDEFGYRIIGIFRGAWNPHTLIITPVATLLVTALTSIIPAKKAVNMSITDALRFE